MSKPTKYYGEMKAGRLHCKPFMDALRGLEGTVELMVKQWHPSRGNKANRYYWGVVVNCIAQGLTDAGYEPRECTSESVHDMLKFRFLQTNKPIGADGEFLTIVGSTTELDSAGFAAYVDHCIRFASEYLGVTVPAPNEQLELTEP